MYLLHNRQDVTGFSSLCLEDKCDMAELSNPKRAGLKYQTCRGMGLISIDGPRAGITERLLRFSSVCSREGKKATWYDHPIKYSILVKFNFR